MEQLIVVLAVITAGAAAVRSTWSPCGLSMLSTVTPMAESGRGRRWGVTATWFVLGAVLGGLTTGAVVAVVALGLEAAALSATTTVALAAVAALVAVGIDLVPATSRLAIPHHRRQVNEDWLVQFRAWVYGSGFGWQIGTGLATYIMTAAVYLTFVLAALTASPPVALALAAWFGLARGLAILAGARSTSTDRLLVLHRRLDRWAEPVRRAVIAVEVGVAAVAVTAAAGPVAGLAVAGAVGGAAVLVTSRRAAAATSTPVPAGAAEVVAA